MSSKSSTGDEYKGCGVYDHGVCPWTRPLPAAQKPKRLTIPLALFIIAEVLKTLRCPAHEKKEEPLVGGWICALHCRRGCLISYAEK